MRATKEPTVPQRLPFLEAICWQTPNVKHFTPDEMLDRYERGWNYLGVLGDVEGEERDFIRKLARAKGSWLLTYV